MYLYIIKQKIEHKRYTLRLYNESLLDTVLYISINECFNIFNIQLTNESSNISFNTVLYKGFNEYSNEDLNRGFN